jgi:hypothetical protein
MRRALVDGHVNSSTRQSGGRFVVLLAIANRFSHKKGSCRARRTASSRKMLGEDIGSEQRRSAKSRDFYRE